MVRVLQYLDNPDRNVVEKHFQEIFQLIFYKDIVGSKYFQWGVSSQLND